MLPLYIFKTLRCTQTSTYDWLLYHYTFFENFQNVCKILPCMEFCITSDTKHFTLYSQHKPNNICWVKFPMYFGYCWCEKQRKHKSARVISLQTIHKWTWWFSVSKLTCSCFRLFFNAPCKKRHVREKHTSYGILKLKK